MSYDEQVDLDTIESLLDYEQAKSYPSPAVLIRLQVRKRIALCGINRGMIEAISMAAEYAHGTRDWASSDPWERAQMETEAKAGRRWLVAHDEEIVACVEAATATVRAAIIRDLIGT